MKICIICEQEFSIPRTGKAGGHNRKICFDCMPYGLDKNQRRAASRQLCTQKAKEQKKALGCSICGYNKSTAALEWHHINNEAKEGDPATLLKHSWEAYESEIKNCVLLCANCHREIHEQVGVG